jgi:hypothetical protein
MPARANSRVIEETIEALRQAATRVDGPGPVAEVRESVERNLARLST